MLRTQSGTMSKNFVNNPCPIATMSTLYMVNNNKTPNIDNCPLQDNGGWSEEGS